MEKRMTRKILRIDGMTCASCERTIEKALQKLEGVEDAKAVYASSNLYVEYDENAVELKRIVETVENLGYRVKGRDGAKIEHDAKGKRGAQSGDGGILGVRNVRSLIGIGIIVAALYLIMNNRIGINFIPEVDQSMGYGILFAVGLLTSLHCIAMCGGINLSQCVSYTTSVSYADDKGYNKVDIDRNTINKNDISKDGVRAFDGNNRRISLLMPSLLYNGGRILSYTVIGGIVGALGSVVSFSGSFRGIVAVVSGLFMIIMGLNMLNIFPWLRRLNPRMPRFVGNIVEKILGAADEKTLKDADGNKGNTGNKENTGNQGNKGGGLRPFYIGLLNGLMPCGPLQAMQLYALGTGSFATGALSMLMFGLGTAPLMFGFGAIISMIGAKFKYTITKAGAVLVIILGFVMANRGLALSGINIMGNGISAADIPRVGAAYLQSGETYSQSGETYSQPSSSYSQPGSSKSETGSGNSQQGSANSSSGINGIAEIQGDIQVVRTEMEPYRYAPIVVKKGIPVRWIINVERGDLNGCNNPIVIPKYGIRKRLASGENIIEFTPESEGTILYTCWMGMIRGYIVVVDDLDEFKNSGADTARSDDLGQAEEFEEYWPGGGGGGCCSPRW